MRDVVKAVAASVAVHAMSTALPHKVVVPFMLAATPVE
jgi:hypothetical protein